MPDRNITPLVVATNHSDYQSMELLLINRADPEVRPDGNTTLLWDAVSAGDFEKTNILLTDGADPTAVNLSSETTVLDLAEELGNEEIIRLLRNFQSTKGATLGTARQLPRTRPKYCPIHPAREPGNLKHHPGRRNG